MHVTCCDYQTILGLVETKSRGERSRALTLAPFDIFEGISSESRQHIAFFTIVLEDVSQKLPRLSVRPTVFRFSFIVIALPRN